MYVNIKLSSNSLTIMTITNTMLIVEDDLVHGKVNSTILKYLGEAIYVLYIIADGYIAIYICPLYNITK